MAGIARHKSVLVLTALLAFMQAIIGQFAVQGTPLFLREAGYGSDVISLIFIAGIPYTFPFLWAPLIDRHGSRVLGSYGGWIVVCQVLSCTLLGILAFITPATSVLALIATLTLLMGVIGTQKTAAGGFVVENLSPDTFPIAAGLQAGAAAVGGFILGAGVLYFLGDVGWTPVVFSLLVICSSLVLPSAALCRSLSTQSTRQKQPPFWSHMSVFKRPESRLLLVVAVTVNGALILPYGLKSVLLIDAGFSVSQSSLIALVLANISGFVGALLAASLTKRFGGMTIKAVCGGITGTVMIATTLFFPEPMPAAWLVVLICFASAMVFAGFTTSRALLMPRCRSDLRSTELASYTSIEAVCVLLVAGLTMYLLDKIGFFPLAFAGGMISLAGAVFAYNVRSHFQEKVVLEGQQT